ncbi:hypothetical protein P43SY_006374 [Pythium insidiosum]|uniref:Transmembrane protein n=1 Tax=Pythium insidiosum TaxID=114742 RepID=A0AAD5M4J5_PYTIN|nr:hypothetical protein P43SY_006374 [Pythium insidiosum]
MTAAAAKKYGGPRQRAKQLRQLRPAQILHLVHRVLIFAAAIYYIRLAFGATIAAVDLLRGRDNPSLRSSVLEFNVIRTLVGTASLRQSPLVVNGLRNSTTPVNGTLYVSASEQSFAVCSTIPSTQLPVFSDPFLRSLFKAVSDGTSYDIEALAPSAVELIAPVVDCSPSAFFKDDSTTARFFFLARSKTDTESVQLVVISMSNQQYRIPLQSEIGSAGVATVQIVSDMRASRIDHHFIVSIGYPFEAFNFRVYQAINKTTTGEWTLRAVPSRPQELPKLLITSSRSGFFIKAESEQSNVNSATWMIYTDPHLVVQRWEWRKTAILHDSWAWVHSVQFFIGMGVLSNLAILLLATYRNFQAGKIWVGDAFVSLSTSQLANGVLVLLSWFMNEYWSLHEFAFFVGREVSNGEAMQIYPDHMCADLLTLYMAGCGLIGRLLRERIDPVLAVTGFLIGYHLRVKIIRAVPSVASRISKYSDEAYMKGIYEPLDGQSDISPMNLFSSHPIGERSYRFVFACLFPIYATLVLIIAYALARKLYHHLRPQSVHVLHTTGGTATSDKAEALVAQKRVYTIFELATGAELENRFGLVADYESSHHDTASSPGLLLPAAQRAAANGHIAVLQWITSVVPVELLPPTVFEWAVRRDQVAVADWLWATSDVLHGEGHMAQNLWETHREWFGHADVWHCAYKSSRWDVVQWALTHRVPASRPLTRDSIGEVEFSRDKDVLVPVFICEWLDACGIDDSMSYVWETPVRAAVVKQDLEVLEWLSVHRPESYSRVDVLNLAIENSSAQVAEWLILDRDQRFNVDVDGHIDEAEGNLDSDENDDDSDEDDDNSDEDDDEDEDADDDEEDSQYEKGKGDEVCMFPWGERSSIAALQELVLSRMDDWRVMVVLDDRYSRDTAIFYIGRMKTTKRWLGLVGERQ